MCKLHPRYFSATPTAAYILSKYGSKDAEGYYAVEGRLVAQIIQEINGARATTVSLNTSVAKKKPCNCLAGKTPDTLE